MLTDAEKKIVVDSWLDETQPNLKSYFEMSAMEGMNPHAVAEEIVKLGEGYIHLADIDGISGQQMAEALLAGQFDQEIAHLMGYA